MKGNNRKKPNALEQYESQRGSLDFIKATDVQGLAIRIFKDIAFGNIDQKDIDKYQKFFLDNDVLTNLKYVADVRFIEEQTHCVGMQLFFAQYPNETSNPLLTNLHKKDYDKYMIFNIIREALQAVLQTKDLRILYSLQTNLSQFRKSFKLI